MQLIITTCSQKQNRITTGLNKNRIYHGESDTVSVYKKGQIGGAQRWQAPLHL